MCWKLFGLYVDYINSINSIQNLLLYLSYPYWTLATIIGHLIMLIANLKHLVDAIYVQCLTFFYYRCSAWSFLSLYFFLQYGLHEVVFAPLTIPKVWVVSFLTVRINFSVSKCPSTFLKFAFQFNIKLHSTLPCYWICSEAVG